MERVQITQGLSAGPDRFPDVVMLPDGRLLLLFERYYPSRSRDEARNLWQELVLLESCDGGRTWGRERVLSHMDRDRGLWNYCKMVLLSDGRLCVSSVLSGEGMLFWSEDMGTTWSGPHPTGVEGIQVSAVVELPDGTLGMGAHRRGLEGAGELFYVSTDGGRSWELRSEVYWGRDFPWVVCEGSYVVLPDGRVRVYLREDRGSAPGLVAESDDCGRRWSELEPLPTVVHQPEAGLLSDGRVLVTFRNPLGARVYGWMDPLDGRSGAYLEIDEEPSGDKFKVDMGGWVELSPGRIFCAYSVKKEFPESRIRGAFFSLEEFSSP